MAPKERPMTIQTDNGDGSFNIRIVDKESYYSDISKELQKSHVIFSDVVIVSQDGSHFNAHKAILSRCKRFERYLQNVSKDDKLWIVLPEASPDIVRQSLLWFYDTTSDLSPKMQEEILNALVAVIGENPNEESDQIESSICMIELEEGQVKEVVCKIDRFTREISCSFCAFGCLNKAQMTMHMAELHKLKVHRNEVVRNNQKSAFDDSSDNDSSTGDEECDTKFPLKCKVCDYTSSFNFSLMRHYATEHYKEKLIDTCGLGLNKSTCSACNLVLKDTTALVDHLADDHSIVKVMVSLELKNKRKEDCPQEENSTSRQIESSKKLCCFFCEKQFEVTINFIRHLAWFHFRSKMLSLGNSVCNSRTCLPSNCKEINKVFHLALKHNGLKFCMTDEDYKKLEHLKSSREPTEAGSSNFVVEQLSAVTVLCDQPSPSFSSDTDSVRASAWNGKRKSSPSKPPSVVKRGPTAPENGGNTLAATQTGRIKVCPICKKTVGKSLALHRKRCKGPVLSCHICGIFHASPTRLLSHFARDHFKRKLAQKFGLKKAVRDCKFCNLNFHNVALLRTHLVTRHSGLDGLVDKSVIQKLLIDVKENLVCDICKRGFTTQLSLKKHIENVHTMQLQA